MSRSARGTKPRGNVAGIILGWEDAGGAEELFKLMDNVGTTVNGYKLPRIKFRLETERFLTLRGGRLWDSWRSGADNLASFQMELAPSAKGQFCVGPCSAGDRLGNVVQPAFLPRLHAGASVVG